jgi:hypothetical protein
MLMNGTIDRRDRGDKREANLARKFRILTTDFADGADKS